MDILCHALESWTARWFADFDAKQPEQRVPYCGANPIADMWAEKSLSLLAGAFRRAVRDGSDAEAREQMALAATFAGLGFGNAGVHVPARLRLPDRRPGPRLPSRGLSRGRADRPARDGRRDDRARRLRATSTTRRPSATAVRPSSSVAPASRSPTCCAA